MMNLYSIFFNKLDIYCYGLILLFVLVSLLLEIFVSNPKKRIKISS